MFPSAGASTIQHRPDLVEAMDEFSVIADSEGFIAHRVFTPIDVMKKTEQFRKRTVESLLQEVETLRAPTANYARGNAKFETATYLCEENAYEEPVDETEATAFSTIEEAKMEAGEQAIRRVAESYERRVAAAVFNTTIWTGSDLTTSVTNEWDDASSATPRADVKAAAEKIRAGCGLWPNALIINHSVFENLKDCEEILDRIKYTNRALAGDITESMIAQALGLKYVIVGGSQKNTANEMAAAAIAPIWDGEYAMVCRVAENTRSIREACIGRTFHWNVLGDLAPPRVYLEDYFENQTSSHIMRARQFTDEVRMHVESGHLLKNITT